MVQETKNAEQYKLQTAAYAMALIIAVVAGVWMCGQKLISSTQKTELTLDNRINPNTATMGSIVRLPGIGPSRAYAIIQYRQEFIGDGPAFTRVNDLENIKGIGPKTAQKLEPFLIFDNKTELPQTND